MSRAPAYSCVPLTPEYIPALAALFEREGSACYCRYWHFRGDKNEWLGRLAHEPEKNREELALAAGHGELLGVVAVDADQRVVGWLKLGWASTLAKLYEQRLYRGLPCFGGDRSRVLAVGCLLVDSEQRRRGIARALLCAGVAQARALGARSIEAFPRRAEGVSDAEHWLGPFAIFEGEGFRVVHDFAPYPVLRLEL